MMRRIADAAMPRPRCGEPQRLMTVICRPSMMSRAFSFMTGSAAPVQAASTMISTSGQAARATRHYRDLVKRLASDRSLMTAHDAAAAMVEAAEHARAAGDEAQALKFYRSAWKLNDPDLQPRISAAIALLRLHVD